MSDNHGRPIMGRVQLTTGEHSVDVGYPWPAASYVTIPPLQGWMWCEKERQVNSVPFRSDKHDRGCWAWDDCPGPHYPLYVGQFRQRQQETT